MSEPSPSSTEAAAQRGGTGELLDLHAYWRTIARRRWIIIPFFLATVLATALVTLRTTRIYDATCTIIIDLTAPRVLDKDSVQDVVESGSGSYWFSKEYYETQYKVITSRAVAQRVVDQLQLAQDGKFLGIAEGAALPAEVTLRPDAALIVQRNLRVEPVRDSRIVRIRYEDPDPARAAAIANAVADAYIAENLAVKSSTTLNASDWLERQLAELEAKLDHSSKELFEFKRSHDIVSTSWEDRQSMVSQRLTTINDALTRARVRRAELQARNQSIDSLGAALEKGLTGPDVEALAPVASNLSVQQLKLRYFESQAECADLRVKYLGDHPKLEACEKKLGVARKALRDEIQMAFSAARKEYQEAQQTERNLQALLGETKSDAFGLNQYERQYLELKRGYDNNQRLYELVLKRLKDTGVTSMLQVSNVRVLDRARLKGGPIRPNVSTSLALAILFGLVGGVAIAFAMELLDTTIASQQQIEERLGLAFLGIIPSMERAKEAPSPELLVHYQPKSAVAECLRAVRTNLLFMSPERPLKTILVTSSAPQEGKTTVAAALAETMAQSGNKVLLVDADLRRPRVHRIFDIANTKGLTSLILGEGKLEDVVQASPVPNLSILASGPVPPNPSELLHTKNFSSLVEAMSQSFDRVVFDSPPVGVVADAVVMATKTDGTLFVLKAGRTYRESARASVKQLRDVNARLLGAILNDLDLSDQRYGQYSYYHQYGYYYSASRGDSKAAT